jgi:hypothetical protein
MKEQENLQQIKFSSQRKDEVKIGLSDDWF